MKKLFTLLSLFVLIGMSANVFAQSSGTDPYPGTTHPYSVTDNTGSSYAWSVTKGDLTTAAGSGVSPSATIGAAISIEWANTLTVGDVYYVHVVEDDGSCTNEKVLKVTITPSPFNLAIAATSPTSCYDEAVDVSLNSTEPEYDHGTATLTYTITPTGVAATESYSFTATPTSVTGYTFATPTVTVGNATVSGGDITVTDNGAVTLQYVVTNGNTYTNSNDTAGDAADFTAEIAVSNGVVSSGALDNGNGAYSSSIAVSRPHTTVIVTD